MRMQDRVARAGDVIFAEIDGEAVALCAEKGVCYGLNSVGLRVLKLIERPATVADICAALIGEYEVDEESCGRQLLEFLADLESEGLLVVEAH